MVVLNLYTLGSCIATLGLVRLLIWAWRSQDRKDGWNLLLIRILGWLPAWVAVAACILGVGLVMLGVDAPKYVAEGNWPYVCICLTALATFTLLLAKPAQRAAWCRLYLPVVVLVAVPYIPFAFVEMNTAFYSRSVLPQVRVAAREATEEASSVTELKVLSVSARRLVVYFTATSRDVVENGDGENGYVASVVRNGNVYWYEKNSARLVWSSYGSADGTIFPPYDSWGIPLWPAGMRSQVVNQSPK